MRARTLAALSVLALACAGIDPDEDLADLAAVDASGPDLTCVLGTPEHCGLCGMVCPPGMDLPGTRRTCSAATVFGACDIVCRGEHYDLDGRIDNGCEALDEPVQDTMQTAVSIDLPDANDPTFKTNPRNLAARIYGDRREHEDPPAQRPLGRDDLYAVTAAGAGVPNTGMGACLGITNFPADNVYQVCITDMGNPTFTPSGCRNVPAGPDPVCVRPPAMTDAGGPYYVRVHKVQGTNTRNEYALFLQH